MPELLAIPSAYQPNLQGYGDILERYPVPVLEAEVGRTVLNGTVLVIDGKTKLAYRQAGVEFGRPDEYESSIWVADGVDDDGDDGTAFEKRSEPLIVAEDSDELRLGVEDPRAVVSMEKGKRVIRFTYNAASLDEDGGTPKVIIKHGEASDDLREFRRYGRLVGSGSPGQSRMKAGVFGPMTDEGMLPVIWTAFSESPAGGIMKAFKTPAQLEAGGIPQEELADMYMNKRREHMLLVPSSSSGLERGPEVGATPIMTDKGLLMFYCPPNFGSEKQWCIGALLINPKTYQVIGRIDDLIVPSIDSELNGLVNAEGEALRVAFPSGATYDEKTGRVRVYYGAGDKEMRMAEGDMSQLLRALLATGNTAENRSRMAELHHEQFKGRLRLSERELGELTIRALSEPNWPY
ncbi:MAG TPA: hypothetical protein VLG92_02460 [Candidatus Saccharimonadia bacterium]|nr:hypothetical protein [Candidatus Saccharimonadia bacterium]